MAKLPEKDDDPVFARAALILRAGNTCTFCFGVDSILHVHIIWQLMVTDGIDL